MLNVPTSTVRFWSDTFPKHIHPQRNNKGNRRFTLDDIETLKKVKFLVNNEGLTLEGVEKTLSTKKKKVDPKIKALESLMEIRKELVAVRKSL